MHLEIKKTGFSANAVEAVMSHGKEDPLFWSTMAMREQNRRADDDADSDVDDFEIFHYLNLFWQSLPLDIQTRIFDCYRRINDQINSIVSTNGLDNALRPLVSELLSYHRLDQIEHWMMLHSDIQIPASLHETFAGDGRIQGTPEKTYLKGDYIKLAAMTIGLKSMLPVWVNYIEATKISAGPTWKEYNAFKLISRTEYYDCAAMRRLRLYIEASIDTQDNLASAIVEGISTEDFPEWLMAITVIRKIVITDIRGIPRSRTATSPVLMSAIHKYVTGKIKRYDTSFIGTVRPKQTDSDVGDSESNISRLEGFKARESIAAGEVVAIEVYFEDPINDQYLYFDPKFSNIRPLLPTFMQVLDTYNQIDQVSGSIPSIKRWQRSIVEWVLRDQLPSRSLEILSKPIELNCFAVTASYLWVNGFKDLALLLVSTDRGEYQDNRPEVDKINKDNLAILEQMYRYQLKGVKKTDKNRNAAVVALDRIVDDIVKDIRYNVLPQPMVEEVIPGYNRRTVLIQPNLLNRLVNLITHLKSVSK